MGTKSINRHINFCIQLPFCTPVGHLANCPNGSKVYQAIKGIEWSANKSDWIFITKTAAMHSFIWRVDLTAPQLATNFPHSSKSLHQLKEKISSHKYILKYFIFLKIYCSINFLFQIILSCLELMYSSQKLPHHSPQPVLRFPLCKQPIQ